MNRAHDAMSIAKGKLLGSRVVPYIVEYGARGTLQQSDSRQAMPGAQQADKAATPRMEDKCAAGKDGAAVQCAAAKFKAEVACSKYGSPQLWQCCRGSEGLAVAPFGICAAAGGLTAVGSVLWTSAVTRWGAWSSSGGGLLRCNGWPGRGSAGSWLASGGYQA